MNTTISNRYQLYTEAVLELAETIVIKSTASADAINKDIIDWNGSAAVDPYDPTTWKYYKNLSGEYHPLDQQMTVVSMDTLENIVFSKENLVIHRATARAYVYGTRQYRELVANYPDQETLILGILYPVDKATAISAANGTILGFPDGLVEENEYNFVPKLQRWLDGYMTRWVVKGFGVTDALYNVTWMGIMHVLLAQAIFNIRLNACKTNEVHSFHVGQYLASHGLNEDHVDKLNLKQSLWLYRNIRYLLRNIGKQENFDWLMENLLTERNLPLAEYTMRHDVSQQLPNADLQIVGSLYPELAFRKKTLNFPDTELTQSTLTLEQILLKENQFARHNEKYMPDLEPDMKELMENSRSSVLMTKYLESSVVDYGDGTPFPMIDVLMGHWAYLSSIDLYRAYITVVSPRTGERYPLSVKDAFVFLTYAFWGSNGITLDLVPQLVAKRVQRIPTPSVDDLMSIVDKKLIPRTTAELLLSKQPLIPTMISTEAFYNTCREIYYAEQLQRGLTALEEHTVKRAMTESMSSRIYSDQVCIMAPVGQSYADWFARRNIVIDEYSDADLGVMYTAMVQDGTGLGLLNQVSLKDIQAAMIGLMGDLSSYSIQLNAEINGNDLIVIEQPAIRMGDIDLDGSTYAPVQDITANVMDLTSNGSDAITLDMNLPANRDILGLEGFSMDIQADSTVSLSLTQDSYSTVTYVQLTMPTMRAIDWPTQNPERVAPVYGIPEYLNLTLAQRNDVIDMYDTGLPPYLDFPDDSLASALPNNVLDGLNYLDGQDPQ